MSSVTAIGAALGTLAPVVRVLLFFVEGEGAKRGSGGAAAEGSSKSEARMWAAGKTAGKTAGLLVGGYRRWPGRYVRSYVRRSGRGEYGRRGAGRSAGGLLAVASRLLPARSRDRYLDEFRSELYDLAAGGAGWWQQVRYAARQFVRSVPVAMAVRASGRRRAAP